MDSLPAELRRMRYAHCVKIRAHGLLYVNRKFHDEFSPLLKKEEFTLGFHIDPSSSTKVTIINPDNSAWGNHCLLDAVSPHPDYSILDSLPIDQFKGIRILIDPPNIHDPGQVVRGWLQSTALVRALLPRWVNADRSPRTKEDIMVPKTRLAARFPPITIQIRDDETRQWQTEGSWNRQLPSFDDWDPVQRKVVENQTGLSDLEVILTPLARLRMADAIALNLPSCAPVDSHFEDFQDRLVDLVTRKEFFGLELSEELEWNDDDVQVHDDTLHVWLDYLLDDMRGPSAANLRRDRFKLWCSEYEYQIGRRVNGVLGEHDNFGGTYFNLDSGISQVIEKSFHDRFMSAREHVNAAYRDLLRRHGHSVYIHADKNVDFSVHFDEVLRRHLLRERGNCVTFWEVCYPAGIEPKSQNDNWEINTEQINLRHRLQIPLATGIHTASQIFPSRVAFCEHCYDDYEEDWSNLEIIMDIHKSQREYLFKLSSRPRPLLLGPIESS